MYKMLFQGLMQVNTYLGFIFLPIFNFSYLYTQICVWLEGPHIKTHWDVPLYWVTLSQKIPKHGSPFL